MTDEAAIDAAVAAVGSEFLDTLNDVAGTHAIAVLGIIRTYAWAETDLIPGRGPNSMLFLGRGDPNTANGFAFQRWPIHSLLERLDGDGPVIGDLGRQWLVMVASQWNDHFRRRFADVNRVALRDVKDAGMADINRMRNDIIHHRAIATEANTGRCEAFHWFAPGEQIHPMMAHVAEFMDYVGAAHGTDRIEGAGPWQVMGGF
jgi:hypothetical protein